MPSLAQPSVADRKDSAMDRDQMTAVETVVDQPLADAEIEELVPGDDPVLAFRELSDGPRRLVESNPIKFASRYLANLMGFGVGARGGHVARR